MTTRNRRYLYDDQPNLHSNYLDEHVVADIISRSSPSVEQSNGVYYWPPGATLIPSATPASTTTPVTPSGTPTSRRTSYSPVRRLEPAEDTLESTLKGILETQKDIQKQMGVILKRVDTIENAMASSSSSSSGTSDEKHKKLPPELSSKVAAIYQALPPDKQFHLDEKANSTWNQLVRKQLKEEIQLDKENAHSSTRIDTAIQRYFESRKRVMRESQPEQKARVTCQEKQRKRRSRRQRLFDRRKKCVLHEELEWWKQLSIEYMSLESSDDEDDNIIVHHLTWRSKRLVDFLKALDTRADVSAHSSKHYAMQRKLRRDGVPAETLPPIGAPKWTVSKEWRKEHESNEISSVTLLSQDGDPSPTDSPYHSD